MFVTIFSRHRQHAERPEQPETVLDVRVGVLRLQEQETEHPEIIVG